MNNSIDNIKELVEDKRCWPLVEFFNLIGLKTKYCCEGHDEYQSFWIMFDESIVDEDIENFITKVKGTGFGEFYKWLRYNASCDELWANWIYEIRPSMINSAKQQNYVAEEEDLLLFKKYIKNEKEKEI